MTDQNFDIDRVQKDIERQLSEMPPIEYAKHEPPIVDYAGYLPATENISAIAVASQYEAAAKQVEAMGEVLKEAAQRAEAMAAKISDALKFVEDTAAAYRTEATLIFDRIEKVDKISHAVIAACEEMKQRIKENGDGP